MILIDKHDLCENGDSTIEAPGRYINLATGNSYSFHKRGDGVFRCGNCSKVVKTTEACFAMESTTGHQLHVLCVHIVHPEALLTAYRKQYPHRVEKA